LLVIQKIFGLQQEIKQMIPKSSHVTKKEAINQESASETD
jgi:hypothetical protein